MDQTSPNGTTAVEDLVRVVYPDPLFRPIPSFSIEVPPAWVISEFPDALYVMGPTADAPGPWMNVIVRHERVNRNTTLEEIAQTTWANLTAMFPQAVLTDEQLLQLPLVHYMREVQITMPEYDEPVNRIETFVFGPVVDQLTVDLFHLTWLNPVSAGDDPKRLYLAMLASFRFEDEQAE